MGAGSLFLRNRRQQGAAATLTKTASATLTAAEVIGYDIISAGHASSPVDLDLPAANAGLAGVVILIGNNGAQTLTVGGNFGAGSELDVTLPLGAGCLVWCDGTNWYALNATVAA